MLSVGQFWDMDRKNQKIWFCNLTEITVLLRTFIKHAIQEVVSNSDTYDIFDCAKHILESGTNLKVPTQCCPSLDKEIIISHYLTMECPEIPIRLIQRGLLYRQDCRRFAYFDSRTMTCESLFDSYQSCVEYCERENYLYLEPEKIHNPEKILTTFLKILERRSN